MVQASHQEACNHILYANTHLEESKYAKYHVPHSVSCTQSPKDLHFKTLQKLFSKNGTQASN